MLVTSVPVCACMHAYIANLPSLSLILVLWACFMCSTQATYFGLKNHTDSVHILTLLISEEILFVLTAEKHR